MPLQVNGAVKTYGSEKVLDGFNINFPEKGTVCLFGPSGCGKTTLLNCIAGLEKLDSGMVSGRGGLKFSCVFQEDRLLPWLSARENIAAVFHDRKTGLCHADEWLGKVGLGGEEAKRPCELSGGMCRRVAIARALAFGGDVFLLDEPFQRLDSKTRSRMIGLVKEKASESLCILVTHDEVERREMADIAYILEGPPLKTIDIV